MADEAEPSGNQPLSIEWYYTAREGAVVGPISEDQLGQAIRDGYLDPDTLVWQEAFEKWEVACNVPSLSAVLGWLPRRPEPASMLDARILDPGVDGFVETPAAPESEAVPSSHRWGAAELLDSPAEELCDALTDEEAAEPIINLTLAREIVDRASSLPQERSIPPASISWAPPRVQHEHGRGMFARPVVAIAVALLAIASGMVLVRLTQAKHANAIMQDGSSQVGVSSSPSSARVAGAAASVRAAVTQLPAPADVARQEPVLANSELALGFRVEGPLEPVLLQRLLDKNDLVFEVQCWKPARLFSVRVDEHPSVQLEVVVDRKGRVYNVKYGRDPQGYYGVAPCIGGRIRGWKFPAHDRTSTVMLRLARHPA